MQEKWVPSQGWEDPLEKGRATHSSILAWRIPWTIQSMGSQRVGHDWVTFTFFTFMGGFKYLWNPTYSVVRQKSESVNHWVTLRDSMAVAHQAPLSMGFPRQEYWSGLPFPSPGDLPDPQSKPTSPALAGRFFTSEPPGSLAETTCPQESFIIIWILKQIHKIKFKTSKNLTKHVIDSTVLIKMFKKLFP